VTRALRRDRTKRTILRRLAFLMCSWWPGFGVEFEPGRLHKDKSVLAGCGVDLWGRRPMSGYSKSSWAKMRCRRIERRRANRLEKQMLLEVTT